MHAADPITVTKTQYVQLTGNLLDPVEAAWGFVNVWAGGDMYSALTHDSQWLTTCKAQLDGIRAAYAAQAASAAATAPAGKPAASVPKDPSQ